MVFGFNHNFRYKGEVFHVQTEDSGVKKARIVTLLYRGGTILSSNKSSYAELCHKDNLAVLVEGVMKEQHRDMLRRLKNGEFDNIIEKKAGHSFTTDVSSPSFSPEAKVTQGPTPSPPSMPGPTDSALSVGGSNLTPVSVEAGLDNIILSYLLGDDY
jgi:hypothetical protein